jgi:nickel transport protein
MMNAMQRLTLLGLFTLFSGVHPSCVEAHGTAHRVLRDAGAITVESFYSDKEPMRYADVLLYGPSDQEIEYQNGRTDQNGRFAFVPDREGTWRINVSDGMGHLMKTDIEVQKPHASEAAAGKSRVVEDFQLSGLTTPLKAALGVSLIANLALLIHLRQMKKQQPCEQHP